MSKVHVCGTPDNDIETYSIFTNDSYTDQLVFLRNTDGIIHVFKFKIDEILSQTSCRYTCYNELYEPLMSGIYSANDKIETTDIYGNSSTTRASLGAWGCGLSIGMVGGNWSTAFGMVSAGAGFAVGMAYTVMAIAMCSD